jgi:hypothetical protein
VIGFASEAKMQPPDPSEWDTSQLPADRRAYLEGGLSFEEIAIRMAQPQIVGVRIRPKKTSMPGVPSDARQIVFLIRFANVEVIDLFYNASDGLRGRYWQNPDHGFLATRLVIDALSSKLLSFADLHPPTVPECAAPMDAKDIKASLEATSAKIWPLEMNGINWLFEYQQLAVSRWIKNEANSPHGTNWRETPTVPELEIKGALLGPDGTQYWPPNKRDRSCQIHHYGFA